MLIAFDESYREASKRFADSHDLIFFDGPQARKEVLLGQLQNVEVLAVRRPFPFLVDRQCIALLPKLQFIHKSGTGVDGFDLEALDEQGILLANNQGVNAGCVAEHIVLLTLLCLRNAYQYLANMRQGQWKQDPPPPGVYQLEGKTVGIVGMGAIGRQVARRMAGFGVKILAHQRHPRPGPAIPGSVEWVSLAGLLSESDVIILCVPLTAQTERMIGASELRLVKRTAVIVNTSRGRVIDEQSLYAALAARQILAAGLDVFECEPMPPDSPLLWLDNVFATPHIAGRSIEMVANQVEATMKEIALFVRGQRPQNLVNPQILEGGRARARVV